MLWLVAIVMSGSDSGVATALDPGRAGSIGAWWSGTQLTLALLVAAWLPGHRVLIFLPGALAAGELAELHVHAATLVATTAGAARHLSALKGLAAGMLGLTALFACLGIRHRSCSAVVTVALVLGGAVSVVADGAQCFVAGSAWLGAIEEWSELAVYSVVTAAMLALKIKS